MTAYPEERQEFTFPDTWMVCEFDKSKHYRKRAGNWLFKVKVRLEPHDEEKVWVEPLGQAGVDFAVLTEQHEIKLIEVKDYRVGATGLPSELPSIVARKVRDSLATLAIACTDTNSDLHTFSRNLSTAKKLTAVLDIQLPPRMDRTVLVDLQQKLRQIMRHAVPVLVAGPTQPVAWTKRDVPRRAAARER